MKVENKSLEYAQKIGVTISKISVRKMTSRWGSCSSSGNLSYALNLVFAPESMVDYVCAHEVSHLIHMNHGKDFWDCTQKLYPEVKVARKWFKENRRSLFCYQLTPRF
jgi:predicted metal-dependent hydrolase